MTLSSNNSTFVKTDALSYEVDAALLLSSIPEKIKLLPKLPSILPLLDAEGSKVVEQINVPIARKIDMLVRITLFVEPTFFGYPVDSFSFEQRVALLANFIITSRRIDSLDETLRVMTKVVSERSAILATPIADIRTIRDAQAVINYLHAIFLLSGQKIYADVIDQMSHPELGGELRQAIAIQLEQKEYQPICIQIMQSSALKDMPKAVISDIAYRVDASVYQKFILVSPTVKQVALYRKNTMIPKDGFESEAEKASRTALFA